MKYIGGTGRGTSRGHEGRRAIFNLVESANGYPKHSTPLPYANTLYIYIMLITSCVLL